MTAHKLPTHADKPVVLGYYADWSGQTILPPSHIPYRLFTHLTHSFAVAGADGSLALPAPATARELSARAHAAGVKTLLALGGANSNAALTRACSTPAGVSRLADSLARATTAGGYDGVDIDWEGAENPADRDRTSALTRALRERLPANALLTMAVPASDWGGKWFDRDALLPHVDYFNIMAYDFHGPWTNHAGHNAALVPPAPGTDRPECRTFCVEGALDYWLRRGFPAERLVLGLPLFGRGFRAARWGDPATGTYDRSEVANRDIALLIKQGWKTVPGGTAPPTLVSPDGKEILSYDDPAFARRKGAAARARHLAGVFFWEISQDRFAAGNGSDARDFAAVRAAGEGFRRGG